MSANFQRVKRDMMEQMSGSHQTQESWAQIMLENTKYIQTTEDQKSFWNWILNPSDSREYKEPVFTTYDPTVVVTEKISKLTVVDEEDEKQTDRVVLLRNDVTRNGLTDTIVVTPVDVMDVD